jgi:hypothetical protein
MIASSGSGFANPENPPPSSYARSYLFLSFNDRQWQKHKNNGPEKLLVLYQEF